MVEIKNWRKATIRRLMKTPDLVGRIYTEKNRYTAQYYNRPTEQVLAPLRRIGRKVVVKQSRVGAGGTTLLNPEAFFWGWRISVYF